MPVQELTERNQLIKKLYRPNKHGYKKLSKQFKISWYTVRDIVEREKKREENRLGRNVKK